MTQQIDLDRIRQARQILEGVSIYTPMEGARWLSALTQGDVRLKCENLQRTGSFKPRGAYVRISGLPAEQQRRGVVAASAGNHAQGVALSAGLLGIRSTVYMPQGAPIPKVNATKGYGADVIFHGPYLDQAIVEAQRFAEDTGATFIHPFDHVDIVAGQGTCGLEILEQCPDVKTVLVPTGGGGLLAGVAIAIKSQRPDVRIIGVQAKEAAAYPPSLASGAPIQLQEMHTMADGIAVGRPGEVPFAAVREYVDSVLTVTEDAMSRALLALIERAKQVVEPAGSAAVAALMERPEDFEPPVVAILSGGNIDPLLLQKVVRHGLAAAGRYLGLRATIPDRPGGLVRFLSEIADAGGNVIDVEHERISPGLSLHEVGVQLQLETRGPSHADELVSRLRDRGYGVDRADSLSR